VARHTERDSETETGPPRPTRTWTSDETHGRTDVVVSRLSLRRVFVLFKGRERTQVKPRETTNMADFDGQVYGQGPGARDRLMKSDRTWLGQERETERRRRPRLSRNGSTRTNAATF
jgi:hypothetical protein